MTIWTDQRIETAKAMLADGEPYSAIAATINMTRNAVIGKMRRLEAKQGVPKHPRANITRRVRAARGERQKPLQKQCKLMEHPKPQPVLAPPSKHLNIHQLTAHICRYIADEGPPWTYCGHDAEPGTSWCTYHASIVYTAGKAP